jgi:hypothetical protein
MGENPYLQEPKQRKVIDDRIEKKRQEWQKAVYFGFVGGIVLLFVPEVRLYGLHLPGTYVGIALILLSVFFLFCMRPRI